MIRWFLSKYRKLRMIKTRVWDKNTVHLSLSKKIKTNLNGFTADEYIRYNFPENNMEEYISEYEDWKTREVNSSYKFIMDNKIVCRETFAQYINMPKNLAWIKNDVVCNLQGIILTDDSIINLIAENKKIIVKPLGSSGEYGVFMLSLDS